MTVYIVDIEGVETRYTGYWKKHIPELLTALGNEVVVIEGSADIPPATSPGAFLNFGGTNIYKAQQVEQIGKLFCDNKIQHGDQFLFTDAWHPGIINLKYMSSLLAIPVTIHGLWHAGSYDPEDFLGRSIGNAPWVRHAEKSFFDAIDHNYFATDFHIKMFTKNLFDEQEWWADNHLATRKIIRTGWPFEDLGANIIADAEGVVKNDTIVFPHRIAPEKQLEIFKDLAAEMPEYNWVVCQGQPLTKAEYHKTLALSKIVFSANLQETLGISCYEGALVGAIPMVPDRLSYTEMYSDEYKYPSEWTESWVSYLTHKTEIIQHIKDTMENYDARAQGLNTLATHLKDEFFSCGGLKEMFFVPPDFKSQKEAFEKYFKDKIEKVTNEQ